MTACHDARLWRPHIRKMTTHTLPVNSEASGFRTADHFVDLVLRNRLGRPPTWVGKASINTAAPAWIGVRSVVLIIVSMLTILVLLPAALVAAGN